MSFPKNTVSVAWLLQHLADKELVILDATIKKAVGVVNEEGFDLQIPGTRYFDLKGNFSDADSSLPNTLPSEEQFQKEARKLGINNHSKIVVYDRLGIYSSPRVWWMFKTMGFENVAILDGGFPAWLRQGCIVEEKQERTQVLGNIVAKLQPTLMVSMQKILQNIDMQDFCVLDARSKGRFDAIQPEPRDDLKGGHIPKSFSLPYTKVLKDGKMRSSPELKAIFDELELPPTKRVYSCGSGITACILMLASEIVGNTDHAIYDGSWTEWGQAPNVPIATK